MGGVTEPVGGGTEPVGGVVELGDELCPVLPEPPEGGVPPAGLPCATAQLAQASTADNNAIPPVDISKPPKQIL